MCLVRQETSHKTRDYATIYSRRWSCTPPCQKWSGSIYWLLHKINVKTLESGIQLVPFIKIPKLPKRSRYKTPQAISVRFFQLKEEDQFSSFHPELLMAHSSEIGLHISNKFITTWEKAGLCCFSDFLVEGVMKSWDQLKSTNPGLPSTLLFSFFQIRNFIRKFQFPKDALANLIRFSYYVKETRGVGNWYQILQEQFHAKVVPQALQKDENATGCRLDLQSWRMFVRIKL